MIRKNYYKKNSTSGPAKRADKKKRREFLKRFIYDYLKIHPCIDCGISNPIVLEFDHINPETKTCNISDCVQNTMGFDRLKAEMAKCEIRCANCHRLKSAKTYNYFNYKFANEDGYL